MNRQNANSFVFSALHDENLDAMKVLKSKSRS